MEQIELEKPKSRRKLFITIGIIAGFLVVAVAAFIGGRLLNRSAAPVGLLPFGAGPGGPGGQAVSMMVEMVPAPELPVTQPDLNGIFAERQDNTIYIQTFSLDVGGGGGVIVSSGGAVAGDDGAEDKSIVVSGGGEGPKVEVVITGDTTIYRDATEMPTSPTSGDTPTKIEQKVEPGTLDDLTTQSMVMVWGRKVGDRVIADVIFYSNPVMIQMPAP